MSQQEFKRLKEIKAKNRDQLMSFPNVTGVGIGRKVVRGELTDQIAIRVYVTKKLPIERLKRNEQVPKEVEGIPTDVVQIGELRRLAYTFHARPAKGGDSVGDCSWIAHGWYTAGTLGGLFTDNTDGTEVILSNNHVMAESDDVNINVAHVGDNVVQPGTLDCGSCTLDVIATLKRWVEYEVWDPLAPKWNKVDAAIAELTTPGDVLSEIHDIGVPAGHRALTTADQGDPSTTPPTPPTTVQKSGRTTEYTEGLVYDVSFDTSPIDMGQGHTARFEDQILIEPSGGVPFSLSGDSGSLVLDTDNKIVGLLFAGSCDGWAVANHIDDVLSALDIRLPGWNVGVCVSLMQCWKEGAACLMVVPCLKEGCPTITPLPPGLGHYAVIDLDKIPPGMRRSVEKMVREIQKHQKQ